MHPPRARLPLVLCALFLGACRSASEHEADADRDVYRILDEVRSKLAGEEAYRVERAPDRLRERLAEQAGPGEPLPPLSLVQVLEIAAENSREFQMRRESLYLQALDLTLQRWNFSVQEIGALGAFFEDDGDDGKGLASDGDARQSAGGAADLAISKLFESGARMLGSIGIDFARDVSSGDAWGAFTNFSFNITQPILRGYGRDIVREPLTQAERDVLYEARAFERFRRTFAFDVASRYFRVLQVVDTLANEELNYQKLTLLRQRNEAFAEAGKASDIEVDQARQDELSAENRVVEVRRLLEQRLDELKLFLGLPVETALTLDEAELENLALIELEQGEIPEELANAVALRERLDHANVLGQVEDAERRVRVLADGLRAGLDVSLEGSGVSEQNQPLDFDGADTLWTASLGLDLPLDRLPERNAYRAGLIALEESRRAAEQSGDEIRSQLRDAQRTLTAASESYTIQTGAVALAERRVESAALNLEAGRASTRDLLEAQESLVQAQNAATGTRIDELLAQLSLFRDLELLRVRPAGLSVDQSRLRLSEPPQEIVP